MLQVGGEDCLGLGDDEDDTIPLVVVQEEGYRLDSLDEYTATFLKGLVDR